MAFSASDLSAVETAIVTLGTRDACEVRIGGRHVIYRRADIAVLMRLRDQIKSDIAASRDDGGLALVKPGGSK